MIDWLKKRLQTAKRNVQRWIDLAEALQEYWEDEFDSEAERLFNMRSIYTASYADLNRIMDGLGDYFSPYIGAEENKPIQIAWRRIELQAKETESLLQMALRRKFLGLDISWIPLYHQKTADYGTAFVRLSDIAAGSESDHFLTSRGKIRIMTDTMDKAVSVEYPLLTDSDGAYLQDIDGNYLISAMVKPVLSYEEFIDVLEDALEHLLPTHIYYMGTELVSEPSLSLYFGGIVTEGFITTVQETGYTG